jgi:hypothetical protein
MARFATGVVVGMTLMAIFGAAVGLRAEDPKTDIQTAAVAAGVDPLDLAGAVASTGLDPWVYLRGVGELEHAVSTPPLASLPPPISGALARADCIIARESGGIDKPNAQGSGALGPGQYMPGTWTTDVALYRAATGYRGSLSLHVLADVRRVMAYVLTLPGKRAQWTVGGC